MELVRTPSRALAGLVNSSACTCTVKTLVCAATLGLGAFGQGHASNLLTNPGFESGGFNAGSNWVLVGERQTWDCGEAHSGACSLASAVDPAGGPNTTFQFVATVPGQEYDFSLFYKRNRNALLASVAGNYEIVSGSVGAFSTVLSDSLTGEASWQLAAGHFVATGPSTRVSLNGEGFVLNALNFDDVVLAPVPEPQTYVMLLAGLIALAGVLRCKAIRSPGLLTPRSLLCSCSR